MKIHRLLSIILLLESRGIMKVKDLSDIMEVSPRTIMRDLEILSESGIPVAAETGPKGGVYLMEGYTARLDRLRNEDIVNMFISGMGVPPGIDKETSQKLKKTLNLLRNILPGQCRDDIDKAENRFLFDPEPWWHESYTITDFDKLRRSVWQSKKIRIVYTKVSGKRTERTIRPYGLISKQMAWYLAAYCEERKEIRIFRCERISAVKILDENFILPEDFRLDKVWEEKKQNFLTERNGKNPNE